MIVEASRFIPCLFAWGEWLVLVAVPFVGDRGDVASRPQVDTLVHFDHRLGLLELLEFVVAYG